MMAASDYHAQATIRMKAGSRGFHLAFSTGCIAGRQHRVKRWGARPERRITPV